MVRRRNGRGIWKVRPIPPLMMACGACPAISDPANSIEPAVGTSVPDSMLKIVLLPEPLGPIRPRISPCSTLNDTLLTAVKPPKRFTRPWTSSTTVLLLARALSTGVGSGSRQETRQTKDWSLGSDAIRTERLQVTAYL